MLVATAVRRARPYRPTWAGRPWVGWAFVLPMLGGLALFQFLPIGVAVADSVRSFNPFTGGGATFAGAANYLALLRDGTFRAALGNTVAYILLTLAIEIPLALVLAQFIDARLPAHRLLRLTMIAGLAASETVAVLVWNRLYDPTLGLFNALLDLVGIGPQPFLTSPAQALPAIVVMSAWKNVGLGVLIFLAGLQNVPRDVLEAASLDGAGPVRRFVLITVPLLRRHVAVAVFISTISGTRIFAPIMLMTQGGPNSATTNLTFYAYQQAFEFSARGAAAATTVVMLVVIGLVTLAQGLVLREKP